MGGDRQNRNAVALAIEQAVDQMQISRTAASGAHRKLPGKMRLGAGGESGGLFMPHVDPVDGFSAPHRVGKPVERIADDTVDALDSRFFESLNEVF
jgi:hypothetical protein